MKYACSLLLFIALLAPSDAAAGQLGLAPPTRGASATFLEEVESRIPTDKYVSVLLRSGGRMAGRFRRVEDGCVVIAADDSQVARSVALRSDRIASVRYRTKGVRTAAVLSGMAFGAICGFAGGGIAADHDESDFAGLKSAEFALIGSAVGLVAGLVVSSVFETPTEIRNHGY